MTRIYIAGPMTGYPELNFPFFNTAAKSLREQGHDAVNPAEIVTDQSADWQTCMRADIAQLVTCDAILLLPGWETSKGATLEAHIAHSLGMRLVYPGEQIGAPA